MNPQVALSFPADYVGQETWNRQLESLRAAVTHLGLKEVAFVLDISGTHLSDSLNERERKNWHARWTHVVKAMLAAKHNDPTAADILRAITDADVANTPFALTEDVTLTPEEEAASLRRELLRFGDAGKAAVERVKKRGRR